MTGTAEAELLRLRAAAHRLGQSQSVATAAERMLAIQAQDAGAAAWALGIRSGASAREVENAYNAGEIVRSWTMRGTLHAVAARDLGWLLSLTADRMLAQAATRRTALGLDEATLVRARRVAESATTEGASVSRDEFQRLLGEAGIDPSGQRGYHLIVHLAEAGVWCWGPIHDGVQRLIASADWIREPRRLERDEALAEFLVRYLTGHGPATVRDFAGWSKLTLADARRAAALAGDRLAPYRGELLMAAGTESAASPSESRAFSASVHLLPGFDEYYLGYADRGPVIGKRFEQAVVPGGNGVFQPTVVAAGRVVGLWRRDRSYKGRLSVLATPFEEFTPATQRGIVKAERSYAGFLGLPVA